MLDRFLHPAKAPAPILVIVEGRLILYKFSHPEKLDSPIVVTELTINMLLIDESSKALSPIHIVPYGISKEYLPLLK